MTEYKVREETIHYAAQFLERWADKAPTQCHGKAAKELREISDQLIETLGKPSLLFIVRKKDK